MQEHPWTKLDAITLAARGGGDAALSASGATSSSFADSWGSSWFRDGMPNEDWKMADWWGIPDDEASPQSIELGDGD